MIPRLPRELDHLIITHLLADLPTYEHYTTRVSFSLVCKAWRDFVDVGQDLVVVGSKNLKAAGARWMGDRLSKGKGKRVKRVYIRVKGQGNMAQAQAVAHTLGRVKEAERVELVGGPSSMKGYSETESSLGDVVMVALGELKKVTHFRFNPERQSAASSPALALSEMARLGRAWPRLEQLDLKGIRLFDDLAPTAPPPLQGCTRLSYLEAGEVWGWGSNTSFKLLDYLPPSLTTLVVRNPLLFIAPGAVQRLHASLTPFPPGIRRLALLDDYAQGYSGEQVERGVHADLIGRATQLTSLEISPCAVADLATALAPLASLGELSVVQGRTRPATAVTHGEMLGLLKRPGALWRLGVSDRIWKQWSKKAQKDVRAAAEAKGIEFVVI